MEPAALEALAELRDIHTPPPVSWWPPAPGWWVLSGLLLLALLLWFGWRYRRQKLALRKSALAELERIRAEFAGHRNAARLAARLSVLLRRVALSGADGERAAALKGEAWLAYLDERGRTRAFSDGVGRALISAPYQAEVALDGEALIAVVDGWIRANS